MVRTLFIDWHFENENWPTIPRITEINNSRVSLYNTQMNEVIINLDRSNFFPKLRVGCIDLSNIEEESWDLHKSIIPWASRSSSTIFTLLTLSKLFHSRWETKFLSFFFSFLFFTERVYFWLSFNRNLLPFHFYYRHTIHKLFLLPALLFKFAHRSNFVLCIPCTICKASKRRVRPLPCKEDWFIYTRSEVVKTLATEL